MARLFDWLNDPQRHPKIVGSRLNDEFDNLWKLGQIGYVFNGTVVASVAGNALTLAVKTLAGADPSTSSPVIFVFRNSTTATGDYAIRSVTAALSITIPSGATLGHASARDQQIIVYAIDNSGTVELAVATPLFDQSVRLKTTTTIGAGSTSASTIYSITGRSNVPWVPIARCVSNQTTAGTWAAVPTQIDIAPFAMPVNACRMFLGSNQTGVVNGTFTKINIDTTSFDDDNIADTTNHRIQPKVPGTYLVTAAFYGQGTIASGFALIVILLNGANNAEGVNIVPAGTDTGATISALIKVNGTSDFLEMQGLLTLSAGTGTFITSFGTTFLDCVRVGP